ncbi:hypothetical protein M3E13_00615 [Oceanobacillus kimchii]|uniref:hypothetical protein n=1 Tax=Oceanobacillus TaxID=182709 RepID=UPI00084E7480|nr:MULTISPECIES: hypothetical protein [Oceanobacillus]MCT1578225.1 hypothetical protein [Oceanobacillus kimchii]MCT2134403.1 hypothetical protein [Oceanobacillus kimchii]OEH54968.1 hypothetical protein AQ616_07945 [Oceanobacillus sp. E9]
MTNNNFNSSGVTEEDIAIARSLKLGLIAGLLTTVGDAIATYAAGVAIEESIQANIVQNTKTKQQDERLNRIERNLELIQQQLAERRDESK